MGTHLSDESRQPVIAPFEVALPESVRLHTPFKRLFDVIVAFFAIILLAPLVLVFMMAIRIQDGQQAIFDQPRLGLGGKFFRCFKLRSMVTNAEAQLNDIIANDPVAREEWERSQKLTNDPRITPLGHFVRKSSIDELPQLINVLKGEMSIVGPRPIVESEIKKYGPLIAHYQAVRPGLTGSWQINGRSDTSFDERIVLDMTYVQNRTFWGDVGIVLKTIPALMNRRGAR